MRLLILIAALIANFLLFQWISGGMALARIEFTILFVFTSTLIVVVAHVLLPELRHDRAGSRLEFFAFVSALAGVVATGAISQGPEAAEDYEHARDRVINEKNFIRELVNELYDPNCEGWPRRARAMSREIKENSPELQSPELEEEMNNRFGDLDRSCFLLWDARSVREEGEYKQTFRLLEDVAEIGAISVPDDLVLDLKELSSDPYILQIKAEELRSRADLIEDTGKVFGPFSNFLVLLALAIGVGRSGYFAFKRQRNSA